MNVSWLIGAAGFLVVVAGYAPAPESLKVSRVDPWFVRVFKRKGTALLGIVLIAVAAFTFDRAELSERVIGDLLIFEKQGALSKLRVSLASTFLHFDVVHLLSNIATLLLFMKYEERIGSIRFVALFAFTGIAGSLVGDFLVNPELLSLGASGAIFGLAGAWIVDEARRAHSSPVAVGAIVIVLCVASAWGHAPNAGEYHVDWIGHLIGVVLGGLAALCLQSPRRFSRAKTS